MKITLPEDISEITLEQYQAYVPLLEIKDKELFDKKKVSLFTGLTRKQLNGVSEKDYQEMLAQIDKALDQGCEFKDRFYLDGTWFGFIPNFDNITTAEFVDLSKYAPEYDEVTGKTNEKVEFMHNLMAILFRPITKTSLETYEIQTYNGTSQYADTMKRTPMNYVNGSFVFFLNLQKELSKATQRYTVEAQKKVEQLQTILVNGDGMQRL